MDDFPSNSHGKRKKTETVEVYKKEAPKEKEKLSAVVSTPAKERKKGLGKRVAETFTGDDAESVGQYILFDVLVPAAKTTISDAVSQGIERLLFGEVRPRPGTRINTPYNRVSQRTYSGGATRSSTIREPEERGMSRRARAAHDFNEIIFATRTEVEEVLDKLADQIEMYGVATVSDLYDLAGITGSFQDDKYGWYDLRGAGARRVREGYLLQIDRPNVLE